MQAGRNSASEQPPSTRIIKRPRLTQLLDAAEARLIVLVAPAGYGKTTLAEQWLAERRAVWYRATSSASDVAVLASGLANAIAPFGSDAQDRLESWLRATPNPESNFLAAARILAEEARAWPAEAWLVIDDFHLIEADEAARSFFVEFERGTAINLLVTARRRPSWTSARRLLYGEVLEVGPSALAMTAEEANAVLRADVVASPPGLVALAEGWPAVIGLAALAGETGAPPDGVLPQALYDFFADELLQTTPPHLRRDLCLMAPAAKVDQTLADHVLGAERGGCFIEESVRFGFLTGSGAERLTFHPLLREFLLSRAMNYDEGARCDAVARIVEHALERRSWDDAFIALTDGKRPDLVPILVEASLDEIVDSGRIASLRKWLALASEHDVRSPLLHLARAEVAYREGLNARAELLALQAADQLDPSTRFQARAYLRAGKAAHFIDRGEEALANFARAHEAATDPDTRREALWGSFVTAVDIEDPRMVDFLSAYQQVAEDGVDDVVRIATGQISLEYRFNNVYAAASHARRFASLINDVKNPLVRTAFWNVYGWALVLGGRYKEALLPITALVDDAKERSVAFAVSLGEFLRANALLGANEIAEARQVADELTAVADDRADHFLSANVRTLKARLALISGDVATSFDLTEREDSAHAENPATCAERLAVRALAFVLAGDSRQAAELAARSSAMSMCVAPQVLSAVVTTLATKTDDRGDAVAPLAALVGATGQVDMLGFAMRARAAVANGTARLHTQIATSIQDPQIKRAFTNLTQDLEAPLGKLSRRELEVLRLVSQGYTNLEIANKLFISEVTVKVHVRHILAKLGARNRAEAAAMAVTQLGSARARNLESRTT